MLTSLAIGLLSICLSTLAVPNKGPTVDTGYAIFIGNHSMPNTAAFLGVPYAESPLGDKRWRAPTTLDTEALKENKRTFDVSEYPDFCVQGTTGNGDAGGAGSEDCLKVVVLPITLLPVPVLVYIHGGGYTYGNPANWPFDHWIEQSPNIVIVSVYYRLNVFGFLAHPALEDPSVGSLNAGFLDQIEALRWVQSHIRSFGGNPDQVTINGQSAGGSSVELHLVANNQGNQNQRLFTGAILQSVFRIGLPTVEQQSALLGYLLQNTSCTLPTNLEQISCLRNASVSALVRSSDWAQETFRGGYNKWLPVIDNTVLTKPPTELLLSGNWAKVPVMAGATSNETLSDTGEIVTSLQNYFPQLTTAEIEEFTSLYPENGFANQNQRVTDITGDITVRCGRELLASVASNDGLPSFAYRYNQPNPSFGDNVDVGHAAENWMMFLGTNTGPNGTTVFTGLNATETAFSQELIAYWLSFVRASNPNTFRLARSPEWPSFTPTSKGRRQVLQQDPKNRTTVSGTISELEPSDDLERCDFTFTLTNVLAN